jgi:putative transposase
MPRDRRLELAGGMHHVTAKAPSGRVLFADSNDCERYLLLLEREVQEREWRLLTFCLMTNHLHLLLQTPATDLGAGLKRIHERFAIGVNKKRGQGGHLFGSRFDNKLVLTDRHVVACLRYIARNPVAASMCAVPEAFRWSGHAALAGLLDPPPWLDVAAAYAFLGREENHARASYVQLVALSNTALLEALRHHHPDRWILDAIDHHALRIDEIAGFLGVTRSTAYRRIAAVRATQGTVP